MSFAYDIVILRENCTRYLSPFCTPFSACFVSVDGFSASCSSGNMAVYARACLPVRTAAKPAYLSPFPPPPHCFTFSPMDRTTADMTKVLASSRMDVIRTVKVSNLSHEASERDMRGFFSFCGEIQYVEMKSENEKSQTAFITYKDPRGAETAILLTGAIIVGQIATIALEPDYVLPAESCSSIRIICDNKPGGAPSTSRKAEDVVRSMLDKGFTLGKDAVNRARAFDERHHLRSTATAKVASLDQKYGLSEKINKGAAIVNDKVKRMDDKFHVSEKTKSAFASAEQTVGTALKNNRYVVGGKTWVTGALNRVAPAGGEVGGKTTEKAAGGDVGGKTTETTEKAAGGEVGGTTTEKAAGGEVGGNTTEKAAGGEIGGKTTEKAAAQEDHGTNVAQQGAGTNPSGSGSPVK
ncbi:Binding partner of ACD11 1 [Sesamum alatum]|uniref:Binding partner of ACD11 1 n=1 Tax=Sesamum alatum TaxID=300844 RepID=A0AAE2CVP1_9LAMI|nr:Binding partner of ACD11 1 [Sesamum alatum]